MWTLANGDTLAGGASVASKVTCTLFGMELTGSTEVYAVLDQRQLANSPATIYTPSGSSVGFVRSASVINTDTADRTFQLFRGGTAAANAITPLYTIQAGGGAFYDDGQGWQFFNSNGQLLTAAAGRLGAYDIYAPDGYFYETIDRSICTETNTSLLSTGRLSLVAIWLPAGLLVSKIAFWSATTALATGTHQLFGLYDNSLALLATSADATSAAWGANTKKELAMVTPYTTTYTGIHYLGLMVAASTVPTIKGNTARTDGSLAAAAFSMGGTSTTGLTTAIPNPAAAPGQVTTTAWGAVG